DDLHLGEVADHGFETLLALDRRRRAGGALQFDDLAIALARLRQPGAGQLALEVEVGGDAGDEQRLVGDVDVAIGQEHRDAGSTASQPVTTTGAMMMASTFWAMKARTAFSCSSCLPWASANFRSMPCFLASSFMSAEKAGRQSPSEPTCEKP